VATDRSECSARFGNFFPKIVAEVERSRTYVRCRAGKDTSHRKRSGISLFGEITTFPCAVSGNASQRMFSNREWHQRCSLRKRNTRRMVDLPGSHGTLAPGRICLGLWVALLALNDPGDAQGYRCRASPLQRPCRRMKSARLGYRWLRRLPSYKVPSSWSHPVLWTSKQYPWKISVWKQTLLLSRGFLRITPVAIANCIFADSP